MTKSMSTAWASSSEMALEGVPGEMATAARIPVSLICRTTSSAFSAPESVQRKERTKGTLSSHRLHRPRDGRCRTCRLLRRLA